MPAKKRIMVVDDEKNLLTLVKTLLGSEDLDVVTVKSGRECLAALEKEKPDLILLDIMMPGKTGLDVAKAIRTNPKTKDMKIVFLTVVKSDEVNHYTLNKLKALDYITKPFENEELVKRIKWALLK